MIKKLTVSVGIPAYNEEITIKQVLFDVLKQEQKRFILKEIIVISDGSTDSTVQQITQIKDPRIKVIVGNQRLGKSARLNQIFQNFSGDVVFLLDADILIRDTRLFQSIIQKTDFVADGIVSVKPVPVQANSFIEHALNYSVEMINEIRQKWNNGRNYLAFRGSFVGLWGKLAKEIHFNPELVSQDAYLFFYACEKGYRTRYFSDLEIYYKSPSTLADHYKQSMRYSESYQELHTYLESTDTGHAVISKSLSMYTLIPKTILLSSAIKYFVHNPFYFTAYCLIFLVVRFKKIPGISHTWEPSQSTKRM